MKHVRYTDSFRYANRYRKSTNTDVAATFRRVRLEQAKAAEKAALDEAERDAKLCPMRKIAK